MVGMIVEHWTWGIPDSLSTLRPASEADYRKIELGIRDQRRTWGQYLRSARQDIKLALDRAGFHELRGITRRDSVAHDFTAISCSGRETSFR